MGGHDGRVGHDIDGRAVEEDVIVMVLQFLHHGLETVRDQQFGRIRRKGSHGNDVQVFGHMLDRIEDMLGLAVQVGRNAMVVAIQ